MGYPGYIHGITGVEGVHLMQGVPGWIVSIHALGRDPNDRSGVDFRPLAAQGFGVIARLQHGWGAAGTIPRPEHYDDYVQRVLNFILASPGCHIWQLGNELNHAQEWADEWPIYPWEYARLYCEVWRKLHALPGHEDDQLVVAPIAPWNNQTAYQENPTGDWIIYFQHVLRYITAEIGTDPKAGTVDAIGVHTYTHGADPSLITSEKRMDDEPFTHRRFHFRTYIDFMEAIPDELRHVPVYLLEIDQDDPWLDEENGWSPGAVTEIDRWNHVPGNQRIRAVVWFRWKLDEWHIEGKHSLQRDIVRAFRMGYRWDFDEPLPRPPEATFACPNCGHELVVQVK